MTDLFRVLFEDSELLAVHKPAGLVCHPTKTDSRSSLIGRMRLYLGGEARPQLINRLDRETSGVTLAAKTPEAARALRRIWENRAVQKLYLAIVHGHPAQPRGCIDAPLGPDEQGRVAIKDCVRADGTPAQTEFEVQRNFLQSPAAFFAEGSSTQGRPVERKPFSLLRVMPRTGRKHQIRIHLAYMGHPLVGEKLYGGDEDLYLALVENRLTPEQRQRLILPFHALHAASLSFTWRGTQWNLETAPEEWFESFAAGSN